MFFRHKNFIAEHEGTCFIYLHEHVRILSILIFYVYQDAKVRCYELNGTTFSEKNVLQHQGAITSVAFR